MEKVTAYWIDDPPVFMWFSYWNHNFERMSNCDVWWPEGMSIPFFKKKSNRKKQDSGFLIALWCFLEVALKDVIFSLTPCNEMFLSDIQGCFPSSWESYSTRSRWSILQSVCHIKIYQVYRPYGSKHCLRKYLSLQIIVNYTPNTS